MVKQLHTKESHVTCQLHCQILSIIYLEFTKKNAKHAWKGKKIKSNFFKFKNNKLSYKCKECERT